MINFNRPKINGLASVFDMEQRTLLAGYYDRSIWINICWFVLIVVTTQILIQIIFYRFIHPLKDFPGPFWWGVTRIPLAWNNFWDTEISTERKLIAKYGIKLTDISQSPITNI
jgi:hypothetical protein